MKPSFYYEIYFASAYAFVYPLFFNRKHDGISFSNFQTISKAEAGRPSKYCSLLHLSQAIISSFCACKSRKRKGKVIP
jgi:hypothetical protein